MPQYVRNIYGGSFGGPIIHNKTFIFGNFQGTRTHQATIRTRTVPAATARRADPLNLVNGITVNDGLTLRKTDSWANPDYNNFAPRVGFACDLFGNGRTAIRGFYGIFYDRAVGAAVSSVDGNTPGFAQGLTSLTTADVRYSQGYPPPAAPTTVVLTLPDTRSTSIYLLNPNLRTGYVHSYNLNVQHQLPGSMVLQVGYVANRGGDRRGLEQSGVGERGPDYRDSGPVAVREGAGCGLLAVFTSATIHSSTAWCRGRTTAAHTTIRSRPASAGGRARSTSWLITLTAGARTISRRKGTASPRPSAISIWL